MWSELLPPPVLSHSFLPLVQSLIGKFFLTFYYVLIAFMLHLLKIPALVNQIIHLSTDEKSKTIFVLHMIG